MKRVNFTNAQRILKQVLDWLQTSKETSQADRIADYSDVGILAGQLNEFSIAAGDNNTSLTPSVTINTGISYDVNSNRIAISVATISYDPALPAHTTNDGLGNLISTPLSTGSKNVPLTVNTNNYIWVDYLLTTDDSVFTSNKVTRAKQFYKQTDGYVITVTLANTPPTANSLKLGNVDLSGSGVVSSTTISTLNRLTSRISLKRVKIQVAQANHADATTSYTFGQTGFLDDHIKAIGTGVVTASNPHGMTAVDLGLSGVTVEDHQKYLHESGVIGDVTSVTSALAPIPTYISPGFDFVTVRKLAGNELVVLDGINKTAVDVPVDTTVNFSNLDATGFYCIYLDKFTSIVQKTSINLVTTPNPTKFLICSFNWTYPGVGGPSDGDISNFVDNRHFGNLASASNVILNDPNSSQLILKKSNVTEGIVSGETGGKLRVSATDNLEVKTNGSTALIIDNTQKTTAQNSINIAVGHVQEQGFDLVPAGAIIAFGGPSAPSGWLLCDGSQVSRATYARLYVAIGNVHGAGDGSTTFHLPDHRGRFLRGVDNGAGRDPDASARSASNAGGNTGNQIGSVQGHNFTSHTHSQNSHNHVLTDPGHNHSTNDPGHNHSLVNTTPGGSKGVVAIQFAGPNQGISGGGPGGGSFAQTATASATTGLSTTASTTGIGIASATATNNNTGGNETRPVNAYVNWIIKV